MGKDNSEAKEISMTSTKITEMDITTNCSSINRKKEKFIDACLKGITVMDGFSQQEITKEVR